MAVQRLGITGQNQYTDSMKTSLVRRNFNTSVWGTFVATVTVQRSFDNGNTWLDVEVFTEPGEWVGVETERCIYRAGVKTGNYTSGTINIRLGK